MDKTCREYAALVLLMIASAVALYFGWRLFWFLTDDAYIAFRYVSNSHLGYGYVWNPHPFIPVEGYTSFLWVAMLDIIWRVFGKQPPETCNWLALLFSYLTLLLSSLMLFRIKWNDALRSKRILFIVFLVLFLLFNRTFLAWTSSGLETALFCFLVTIWVYIYIYIKESTRQIFLGILASALLALTRPDGLLFCGASLGIAFVYYSRERLLAKYSIRNIFIGISPLLVVLVHLFWRFSKYGAWLPNTYYAKISMMWPKSGIIYALSFILEYALWIWIGIVGYVVVVAIRDRRNRFRFAPNDNGIRGLWRRVLGYEQKSIIIIVATLLFHLAYYTFVVGGDHFEYRVYNQIIPFIFVSYVWAFNRIKCKSVIAISLSLAFLLLSLPVPWTHWALTRSLNTREKTRAMIVPVAPSFIKPLQWYASMFDKSQSWLISHAVCRRHQEHKIYWNWQSSRHPTRDEGIKISNEGFPVHVTTNVGIASWVLPYVNIIDKLGLNDYVIARTPVSRDKFRKMAHDRDPPKGYIESFAPNVSIRNQRIVLSRRRRPLSEEDILRIEGEWRRKISGKRS